MPQHKEFCKKVRQSIKKFCDNNQLCDFEICVEGTSFRVHKLILAASSDYFRAMLLNDTLESRTNKVSIQDISADLMKVIINFLYTSEITIDLDNVQDVLVAASILQIDGIQSICIEFIKRRIDVQNCSSILELTDRYNLKDLYQCAFKFVTDNFQLIVNGDEFTALSEAEFTKIISSDQLHVDNERQVFDAAMKWASADESERLSKLDKIMSHVRFALMDPFSLACMVNNPYIQSSDACRRYVELAKNYLLLKSHPEKIPEDPLNLVIPAIVERRHPAYRYIFAIGGWGKAQALASVEFYNPFSDKWVESIDISTPRCGMGVTVLNNSIYVIGGHSGTRHLSSVELFDVCKGAWSSDVANLPQPRTSVGVVTLDGYIYAIGGQSIARESSAIITTTSMERYSSETNAWETCESMEQKRLGAGVTILNGLIFVIGGAENSGKVLNSVECYDPRSRTWFFRRSMQTKRKHVSCVSHDGKIYAVGGVGQSGDELDTAECYDPKLEKWEPIPNMSEKRSGAAMVVCDDLLYVVGGDNGQGRLKLVEAYDPIRSEWTIKTSMLHERLGCGLAVVTSDKNLNDELGIKKNIDHASMDSIEKDVHEIMMISKGMRPSN